MNEHRVASMRGGDDGARAARTFGLFLNLGANLGPTPEAVFDLTLRQAELAEATGHHDLWVTEHHFIRFGINPSALTTAAFLLGRTSRVRVGTAVVLSPLCHPVELAERTALLDQFSGGRFDLGIGRGGYVRDYEVLGVETTRWDADPEATARTLLEVWTRSPDEGPFELQPPPRTRPHPPLLLATSSDQTVKFAAEHGLALQHYFAAPPDARVAVEERYRDATPAGHQTTDHLHTLIVVVTDPTDRTEAVREQLGVALTDSFRAGDHPAVPQAVKRHVGPDGKPLDRAELAAYVAKTAIVGPPGKVVDELGTFIETTGARRLALYHEAVAAPDRTLASIERFAADVAPHLTDAPVRLGQR